MKKIVLGIIIGILIMTGVGVVAYNYNAKDISYTPNDKKWNVSNVESAINELYNTTNRKVYISDNKVSVPTDQIVDFNIGFKPKIIILFHDNNTNNFVYLASTNKLYIIDNVGNDLYVRNLGTYINSITDTGFTFKNVANSNITYINKVIAMD